MGLSLWRNVHWLTGAALVFSLLNVVVADDRRVTTARSPHLADEERVSLDGPPRDLERGPSAERPRLFRRNTGDSVRLAGPATAVPLDFGNSTSYDLLRVQFDASAEGIAAIFNTEGSKVEKEGAPQDNEPDISEPGPDMGDFPNSAFTLKKGRAYVETGPLTFMAEDSQNPASYATPFLLRYGLTDDCEFRLLGNGLTYVDSPSNTFGFGPLTFDFKVHLWNENKKYLLPAVSLEVALQTNIASPEFQIGTLPSVNLNFDYPILEQTNVEMTVGYGSVPTAVSVTTGQIFVPQNGHVVPDVHILYFDNQQFLWQWAIEQDLTDQLQVFLHGQYLGPVFRTFSQHVIGGGFFLQLSKRTMLFGSLNGGLNENSPPFVTQLGIAFAF